MFPYYGGKKQIIHHFPLPKHNTIIEPFAGAAAYALHNAQPDTTVILIEKNPDIAKVWKYLKRATCREILLLPIPRTGETLAAKKYAYLTNTQRKLISLFTSPHNSPYTNNMVVSARTKWNKSSRLALSKRLKLVRNWIIYCDDYNCLKNIRATWFIDPPYQTLDTCTTKNGRAYGPKYGSNSLDYSKLASFVRSCKGQLIVTEKMGASWLPFRPFISTANQNKQIYVEAIYLRNRK